MFEINPLNPIRFVPILDWDRDMYQTIPFDKGLQEEQTRVTYQNRIKYYQKFITQDAPIVQILSSFTDITAKIRRCRTGEPGCLPIVVATPDVVDTETDIVGNKYSCFEVAIDCSLLEHGKYDCLIEYTDLEDNIIQWVSEPFDVAESWPKTRCFQYTNSRNDGFVFKHTINDDEPYWGIIRIEADIIEFKPSSVDLIYNDQIHNTTSVNIIPFRQYSLCIGGDSAGIPDYLVDKVNRILACDQVKIDNQYYSKSEGAQWEEFRPNNYQFSAQKISITESENRFQYQVDVTGITQGMMAIQEVLQFPNNTTDILVTNKFKKFTRHEFISVFNPTGATFEMIVQATSADGINDMGPQPFAVNGELIQDFSYEFPFDRLKSYSITNIDGIPLSIFIGYKRLDAINGSVTPIAGAVPSGVVCFYHMSNAQFLLDFDPDTGLGVIGGNFDGWSVCNADHGTPDINDRAIIASDGKTNIVTKPINTHIGSWLKQILITDLPVLSHKIFGAFGTGTPPPLPHPYVQLDADGVASPSGKGYSDNDFYRMGKSADLVATLGKTSPLGGKNGDGTGGVGQTLDITPNAMRLIAIKKL